VRGISNQPSTINGVVSTIIRSDNMNGTSGISKEHLEEQLVSAKEVHPNDVDALLAKELNSMTFKERELVYEEIHGVDERTKEDLEFVNERLEALEKELQRISKKMAYDQAEQISKGYVNERSFRLMFLRSKYFDARKAAVSLVHFMEEKLKYFGIGALARPLYLSDLDRDDLALLKSGSNQLLPARDRAGRAIFGDFNLINNTTFRRPENVVRDSTNRGFNQARIMRALVINPSFLYSLTDQNVYLHGDGSSRGRGNTKTRNGWPLLFCRRHIVYV
jgi:hypothetical protein